ncbi:hypothetical protein MACK_002625 [Theileria orientalis]|uniref:TFIIS N-terminal domain-containing protein n=1 Tax=Theileria orientalis TaxID=68886 RepID=A0A976MDT3_THEOR|nr:hypothetical protein MACK_002625 [Theileria orientalis]
MADVNGDDSAQNMFSNLNESPKDDSNIFIDDYGNDRADKGFDVKVPNRKVRRKTKKSLKKADEDFVPAQTDFKPDLDDYIDADFEEKPTVKKTKKNTGKEYFDGLLKNIKDRKRHSLKLTDEECRSLCRGLAERMMIAYREDLESIKNGKPGLAKLKMLNSLSDINKPSWRQWCITEGVATALASWLDNLPDGSLPNLTVRTKILEIALQLPLQPSDLRETGLGRKIVSLWNHPDECDSNRTIIRAIVQKWTRPMLGIASSYAEAQEQNEMENKPPVSNDVGYKDRKFNYTSKSVAVSKERIKSKLSQMYRSIESRHKTPGKATRVNLTGGLK